MSHVWASIACRASHTRSTRPLLHLFAGYARSAAASACPPKHKQPARWNSQIHLPVHHAKAHSSWTPFQRPPAACRRPLSTTTSSWAAAKSIHARQDTSPTTAARTHEVAAAEPASLTWRDYDPVGGMPLPTGELTQDEINAAFDSEKVDVDVGNYVLNVMHWRRLSGALIDVGLDFPEDSGVDRDMALKGLQYVRDLMPELDESAAGQAWAEEEAQRVRQEYQDRAVKLGVYKPASDPDSELWGEETEQGTDHGRERTGTSALQQLRKENEANWELQQKANAIKEAQREQDALHSLRGPLDLSGRVQPPVPAAYAPAIQGPNGVATTNFKPWLQPYERKPWVEYYEKQADLTKEYEASENMSHFRRFGPASAVLVLVLAGCLYLSEYYSPPPNSARLWPDIPPSQATLIAMTGILGAIFCLGRFPPLWRFYNQYMCINPKFPYALGLVGAAFNHETIKHVSANLLGLWICGLFLHEDVGRGSFLAIFLASAVGGSFTTLAYHGLRQVWGATIKGSSTAVYGVAAATVTLRPEGHIRAFDYELPWSAWFVFTLICLGEVVAIRRGVKTGVDHMGHLGGAFVGLVSGLYLRSQAKQELTVPFGSKTWTAKGERD